MRTYILRRKGSGVETVRGIVESMNSPARSVKHTRIHRRPPADLLIRWNCRAPAQARFEVNTVSMLELVNDKPRCRKLLIDNDIPVPRTAFTRAEAAAMIAAGSTLIGRRAHHSQGIGMRVARTVADLQVDNRSAYWSEFIPKDREYRVYTFFGKILGLCEKIPSNPAAVSWNNSQDNGTFETVPWKSWPLDVTLLALKATKVCGVDFSAVDIVKRGADSYVLELNNAPTCSEYRQDLFARAFDWLVGEIESTGVKPPHRDLPEVIKTFKSMIHKCLYTKGRDESAQQGIVAAPLVNPPQGQPVQPALVRQPAPARPPIGQPVARPIVRRTPFGS